MNLTKLIFQIFYWDFSLLLDILVSVSQRFVRQAKNNPQNGANIMTGPPVSEPNNMSHLHIWNLLGHEALIGNKYKYHK